MKRREGIIFAVILLAGFCGIGYVFLQKHSDLQTPSAFAQAQPDVSQLTYANNGQLLMASDSDYNVTFWDTTSKKQVGQFSDVGRFVDGNKNGTLLLFSDLDKLYRAGQRVRNYHLNFIRVSANDISSTNFAKKCSFKNGLFRGR